MNDWIDAGSFDAIDEEDLVRFDHAGKTFAIYRIEGTAYATAGMCTHEGVHLCDGLVMGHTIECPKHSGRFDVRDGSPLGPPVCVALKTYPARVEDGRVLIDIA